MKATVIYHNKDLDGYCSGAIARQALENQGYEVEMVGWNYGDEPYFPVISDEPSLPITAKEKRKVVMVDITYPMGNMLDMDDMYGDQLTVIDHHRSFIEQAGKYSWGAEMILDESYAACELTWMHFMKGVAIPFLVNAIAVWDIHRKEDCGYDIDFEGYAQLQLGLQLEYKDPNEADQFMDWVRGFKEKVEWFGATFNKGELLQLSLKNYAKKLNERVHTCVLMTETGGVKFNCVNSGVNKHVEADGRYPLCFYYYDGSKWVYSLRQNENKGLETHPILEVAKFHGGGGHPNACGFASRDLIFGI